MIKYVSLEDDDKFSKEKDRVVFFDYKAAVSEMFLMHTYVLSGGKLRDESELKDLVGSFVKLKLSFSSESKIEEQYFSGLISSATYVVLGDEKILGAKEKIVLKLEIRPALYLLKFSKNFRSFINKSNDVVVKAIFGDFHKKCNDFNFEESYVDKSKNFINRLNINQIGETDFDFIMRLLSSEGISFYFKQEEKGHTIVLTDNIPSHFKSLNKDKKNENLRTYNLIEADNPYKFFTGFKSCYPRTMAISPSKDSLFVNYNHKRKLALAGYELSGWDFRDSQSLSSSPLEVSDNDESLSTVKQDIKEKSFHSSLQNSDKVIVDDNDKNILSKQGLIHAFSDCTDANIISGQSSLAREYFPVIGDYIDIKCYDDFDASKLLSSFMDKDKKYYLCEVFYVYQNTSYFDLAHDGAVHEQLLIFDFKAFISNGQFVKLPKKRSGVKYPSALSAKIYGKEKIHVLNDKDLVIKIMFPWHDKFNEPSDGKPSGESASSDSLDVKGEGFCWARVSQPWVGTAGDDSGSVVLPRPGNEVYVLFQDDENEWPVVMGSAYNSKEKIPVNLTDSEKLGDIKFQFPPKNPEVGDSKDSLVGQAKLSRATSKDDTFSFQGNYLSLEFDKKIDIVTNELSITVGEKGKECVMITVTPKGFEFHQVGENLSVSIHDDKNNSLTLGESFVSMCQGDHSVDAKGVISAVTPEDHKVEAKNIALTYKTEFKGAGGSVDLGYSGGSVKGG